MGVPILGLGVIAPKIDGNDVRLEGERLGKPAFGPIREIPPA
jgi:hypothetical protein